MRRPLIVGASGFLGRRLAARLAARGIETHCLAFVNRASAIPDGLVVHRVVESDPASMAMAIKRADPDVVFNVAAAGVRPEERQALALLDGNVGLLCRLLMALRDQPLRHFFHCGSWLEYAEGPVGRLVPEDHPLRPASLYGGAKAAATVFGHALAAELGIPMTTLRLFHVYGPGESSGRLTSALTASLSRDEPCPMTCGEQIRDMIYVDDAIDALMIAAETNGLSGLVYNVCSGEGVTIRAFAELLARMLAKPRGLLRFGELPYRAGESMWCVGDPSLFRGVCGWRPRHDVPSGLAATIAAAHSLPSAAADTRQV